MALFALNPHQGRKMSSLPQFDCFAFCILNLVVGPLESSNMQEKNSQDL